MRLLLLAAALAPAGCGPQDPPVPPEALAASYDGLGCPDLLAEHRRQEVELVAAKREMDVATRTRMNEGAVPGALTGLSSDERRLRRRIEEHQVRLDYIAELLEERWCEPLPDLPRPSG